VNVNREKKLRVERFRRRLVPLGRAASTPGGKASWRERYCGKMRRFRGVKGRPSGEAEFRVGRYSIGLSTLPPSPEWGGMSG
jgi:hypothetical protein